MNLILTVHHVFGLDPDLKEILQAFAYPLVVANDPTWKALTRIEQKVDRIIMDDTLVKAALDKIDAATTKTAANEQIIANTLQVVSDEMDALIKQLKAVPDIDPALIARATSLADRTQAASDFLDLQVPVLQAIATKGHNDPVPDPPPPPPPPADPTPVPDPNLGKGDPGNIPH